METPINTSASTDSPIPTATVETTTAAPTPTPTNVPVNTYTPATAVPPSQVYAAEVTEAPVAQMVSIAGMKNWEDNGDYLGLRPKEITVRLLRNGEVVQEQVVSAASGWQYSFTNLPDRDVATGETYTYSISERMVSGYYMRQEGYSIVNVLLPGITSTEDLTMLTPMSEISGFAGTNLTEEELEGLLELFDYGTPMWSGLLGTGDDLPAYPFIFGGIGALALLALLLGRKRKAQKES